MPESDYLTTREAAQLLHISPESVVRWILHRGLPAVRRRTPGGRWRYLIDRLEILKLLEGVPAPPRLDVRERPAAQAMSPYTREVLARCGLLRYCRGED